MLGTTQEGEVVSDVLKHINRRGGKRSQFEIERSLKYKHHVPKIKGALKDLEKMGESEKQESVGEGTVWRIARR